ncbi:MAG: hypothetical protein JWN23_2832 [Rhodocyclales bacterium]|nr:hypothetical protein [Rhodocyclales bacterium]
MRKPFIIVIIVLLSSMVGYMSLDRYEKDAAQEHTRVFKAKLLR